MFKTITDKLKNIFKSTSHGDSLKEYIIYNNPKSTADIELLEKQWAYKSFQNNNRSWL
jgi:hypothetical protein